MFPEAKDTLRGRLDVVKCHDLLLLEVLCKSGDCGAGFFPIF